MKTLTIVVVVLTLGGLIMAFQTSDGKRTQYENYSSNSVMMLPLKQKDVIVTQNEKRVKRLIKMGYVVEDVDVVSYETNSSFGEISTYYTLIKY